MIPKSYTLEEFADYLRYDVLLESADALGWGNLVDPVDPLPEVKTIDSSTTTQLTLTAGLANQVPHNTLIVFEDGTFSHSVGVTDVAATVIELQEPIVEDVHDDEKILIKFQDSTRVLNPKYIYVADETLRQMGLENIELINESNIRVFRMLGRLELLRRVSEDRVSKYDDSITWYDEDKGNVARTIGSSPSVVNAQVLTLYNRELNAISQELNPPVESSVPQLGIPAESLSQSSGVALKW